MALCLLTKYLPSSIHPPSSLLPFSLPPPSLLIPPPTHTSGTYIFSSGILAICLPQLQHSFFFCCCLLCGSHAHFLLLLCLPTAAHTHHTHHTHAGCRSTYKHREGGSIYISATIHHCRQKGIESLKSERWKQVSCFQFSGTAINLGFTAVILENVEHCGASLSKQLQLPWLHAHEQT